ncbi:hypothetical protein PIB30_025251 [Stylosanthes scabra]|uniref:Uncharacterized protein n=1 Tax=Stylosanthes scabra TaxID=79078 RepID=A0ABU6SAH4_9FABA|nr:hypothetical protein [Stylosanthes scabra]
MKERGAHGFLVQRPSRGHAMPIARARPQMSPRGRTTRVVRARGPFSSSSKSTKCWGVDAPRPSRGHTRRMSAPRKGRERAMQLGSFGRMWPSSPRGCAKAIARVREACGRAIRMARARGGSSSENFGNLRSCGRATKRERPRHCPIHQEIRLEELYHGGVSPT